VAEPSSPGGANGSRASASCSPPGRGRRHWPGCRFPGLHAALTSGGWASLYDVSPDWQPVIGEIAPGIFVDAGTSGHGFKVAPMLAKHIADLIVGKVVDPALEDFDPFRFERGRPLAAGYRENRILG